MIPTGTFLARSAILAAVLAAPTAAHAAINLVVAFTVVEDEQSPEQRLLSARHMSNYTFDGHNVRMNSDTIAENSGAFGQGHMAQKTTGATFIFQSNVKANGLVLREIYATETITTIIKTNGRDSCTATRTDVLRPGQIYFRGVRPSDGQRIVSLNRRYENVTCNISN